MERAIDTRNIVVGQRVYCSLHWAGEGTVIAIEGEQSPQTCQNIWQGVGCTGGKATFKIVFDSGHIDHGTPESLLRTSVQWQILDEIDTPAQMQERIEYAMKREKEKQDQERAAAAEAERQRAELPGKYPHLIRAGQNAKLWGPTLAATNIREELKRAFPGIKFSVKTEKYSGGNSVNIHWDDGPTSEEVKAITGKYAGGSFNGMEDIYEYNQSIFCDLFGEAKYVFENRSMSAETEKALTPWAEGLYAAAKPGEPPFGCCGVGNLIWQLVAETSLPAGATVTGAEPHNTDSGVWKPSTCYRVTYTLPQPDPQYMQPCMGTQAEASGRVTVTENDEKDGIEIRFPSKPAASVLDTLKAHGWRWSRFASCWYTRRSEEARTFAHSLQTA